MYIGENLNYSVGRLHYSSDVDVNPTTSDTSETTTASIIIFAAIATVIVLIIILLVIVIVCGIKKKTKKKQTIAFTGNTDVSMYASPAYGTHQVLTEPGLDHLYEHIDESCREETTTLQNTASPIDDDKIDADGYLKMNPSCEVVDQAAINSNECDTGSHSGASDEYIQAADDDHMSTNDNDEDDGYENDDQQKNDYLQLKADHEDTVA